MKNRASKTLGSASSSGQPKPNDELPVPTPYPRRDAIEDPVETIEWVDVDMGGMELIDVEALSGWEVSLHCIPIWAARRPPSPMEDHLGR